MTNCGVIKRYKHVAFFLYLAQIRWVESDLVGLSENVMSALAGL